MASVPEQSKAFRLFNKAFEEIISTEASYNKALKVAIDNRAKLKMPNAVFKSLKDNWEKSNQFLKRIEEIRKRSEGIKEDKEKARARLEGVSLLYKNYFRELADSFRAHVVVHGQNTANVNLQSALILPIQRGPRHELLFNSLMGEAKSVGLSDENMAGATTALQAIKNEMRYVNSGDNATRDFMQRKQSEEELKRYADRILRGYLKLTGALEIEKEKIEKSIQDNSHVVLGGADPREQLKTTQGKLVADIKALDAALIKLRKEKSEIDERNAAFNRFKNPSLEGYKKTLIDSYNIAKLEVEANIGILNKRLEEAHKILGNIHKKTAALDSILKVESSFKAISEAAQVLKSEMEKAGPTVSRDAKDGFEKRRMSLWRQRNELEEDIKKQAGLFDASEVSSRKQANEVLVQLNRLLYPAPSVGPATPVTKQQEAPLPTPPIEKSALTEFITKYADIDKSYKAQASKQSSGFMHSFLRQRSDRTEFIQNLQAKMQAMAKVKDEKPSVQLKAVEDFSKEIDEIQKKIGKQTLLAGSRLDRLCTEMKEELTHIKGTLEYRKKLRGP